MTRLSRRAVLCGSTSLLGFPVFATARELKNWPRIGQTIKKDPKIEARITTLLSVMTVEEKVGQMVMAEIAAISPTDLRKYHIGGVLNAGGSWPTGEVDGPTESWLAMAEVFHKASVSKKGNRAAIPVIWGTDAVHGHNNVQGATVFPHNIGLGAANDLGLMRDIGTATAREIAATGIDWTFAPSVAVSKDQRWGRTYESYSSDPSIVANLTKDFVVGLQGHPVLNDFLNDTKVVGTAKHFIGDGGTINGKDQGDVEVSEAELIAQHLPGYIQAIGAGVQTVMASFSSWKGDKLHGNRYLLTDVLKGRLGFDGFVVGDWNGHEQLQGCSVSSCEMAINAGVDMIMVPNDWKGFIESTLNQVAQGLISFDRVDDAVRRVLRVKLRAGLMDGRSPKERALAGRTQVVGLPAHRAIARDAVRKSLVLLKNESVLPISQGETVAVMGKAADHPAYQNGGWTLTWQGRDQETKVINPKAFYKGHTTILAGLKEVAATRGQTITTDKNVRPDVAIIVFSEAPYAEFEGDLGSLDWDVTKTAEFKNLQRCKTEGIPTVAVLMTGRPRGVDPIFELADAVIAVWLPGSEGAGVGDVLLGDIKNSSLVGRLPFDWPKTGGGVRYPLGYGLEYEA